MMVLTLDGGEYAMPVITSRLSRLLGERRMSVSRLAELSGVSRRALHDLYHDTSTRIDYATLDKVCRTLDVQVGDLLERVPDPAP